MVPSLLPPEDSSRYGQTLVQRSDRTMWYDKKAVVAKQTLRIEKDWWWGPQFQEGSSKLMLLTILNR